jgi:hypothetical protein
MTFSNSELKLNKNDHLLAEQICKLICVEEGVPPDKEVTGLGVSIDTYTQYRYWQYRLPMVRKILDLIENGE